MTALLAVVLVAIVSMSALRGIMTRGARRTPSQRSAFASDSSTTTSYDASEAYASRADTVECAEPNPSCDDSGAGSDAGSGDCGSGDSGGGGSSD